MEARGAGVEGRETTLELIGPCREPGDLGCNLPLEGRAVWRNLR